MLHHVDTPSITSTEVIVTAEEIISKYKDVFAGLGCLPGEVHLEVDNAAWGLCSDQDGCLIPLKEKITKATDVIMKVTERTLWISNMDVIEKHDKL